MSHRRSQRQSWPCGAGAPHLPSVHTGLGEPQKTWRQGPLADLSLNLHFPMEKLWGRRLNLQEDWINRFYEKNRSWQKVPFRNLGRASSTPADPEYPDPPWPPSSAATAPGSSESAAPGLVTPIELVGEQGGQAIPRVSLRFKEAQFSGSAAREHPVPPH